MDLSKHAFFEGKIVPLSDAKISIATHDVGDQPTNLRICGRVRRDRFDFFLGIDLDRHLAQFFDDSFGRLQDAALEKHRVVAGFQGAQTFIHNRMGLLEYPHYTKPPEFRGWKVPEVLASGNHAKIEQWRREQALSRTYARRPDMLEKAELTENDRKFIESLRSRAAGESENI